MLTTLQIAERYGTTPARILVRARQRGVKPSGRVGKRLAFAEADADLLVTRAVGRPVKPRCVACGK